MVENKTHTSKILVFLIVYIFIVCCFHFFVSIYIYRPKEVLNCMKYLQANKAIIDYFGEDVKIRKCSPFRGDRKTKNKNNVEGEYQLWVKGKTNRGYVQVYWESKKESFTVHKIMLLNGPWATQNIWPEYEAGKNIVAPHYLFAMQDFGFMLVSILLYMIALQKPKWFNFIFLPLMLINKEKMPGVLRSLVLFSIIYGVIKSALHAFNLYNPL